MSIKDKLKPNFFTLGRTTKPSRLEKHPQSNALQSPKFEVSRYLNAVVVNDPSCLFHLFKKAGDGYTHNRSGPQISDMTLSD